MRVRQSKDNRSMSGKIPVELIIVFTIAVALAACGVANAASVLCGADVLKRDGYKILEGKPLPHLLKDAPDVKLVKLLAPEHGLYGTQDEKIKDTTDPTTGLPVLS